MIHPPAEMTWLPLLMIYLPLQMYFPPDVAHALVRAVFTLV